MIKKVLLFGFLVSSLTTVAQPFPPGGPNGGGPPNPPGNYCQQFPDDPACAGSTAVPIGDWKWQLGAALLISLYAAYKLNGNSLNFKKS